MSRIDAAALRASWGQRRVDWPEWANHLLPSAVVRMAEYDDEGFLPEAVQRVARVPYEGGRWGEDMCRRFAARLLADWFMVACEMGFDPRMIDEAVDLATALMSVMTGLPPVLEPGAQPCAPGHSPGA